MIQYKVLQWAFSFLEKYGRERAVAEILLQFYTKKSREQLYTSMREPLEKDVVELFKEAIKRHALYGVPVQHITNDAHFYGRTFYVDERVLIPRPETEELVEKVIVDVRTNKSTRTEIVDIGTGSGIIAITLALELKHAKVYATDISEEALVVAEKNAKSLGADVQFFQGNFLEPLLKRHITPNYIVSNPPYIAEHERSTLADTVVKYDPELALFAKDDGLRAYKVISEQISHMSAKEKKRIFFEIGHTQKDAVIDILHRTLLLKNYKTYRDINGRDRIIQAITKRLL